MGGWAGAAPSLSLMFPGSLSTSRCASSLASTVPFLQILPEALQTFAVNMSQTELYRFLQTLSCAPKNDMNTNQTPQQKPGNQSQRDGSAGKSAGCKV